MRQLRTVEPVDLAALTRELLSTAEPRLRLRNLQMDVSIAEGVTVRGDRFLIAQALQNLLDNAIDFSPHGGALTVSVRALQGAVEWSVRDEGPGVPDYAAEKIFDRFYSLPRADTQEKSSGLGLCLVKEVSELHGGKLKIDNVSDPRGCRASWTLPA
jgi:two-component system sensor histidine kinase CreC